MLRQRVDWSLGAFSRRHIVCVPEETPVDLASVSEESEKVARLPHVHSIAQNLNVAQSVQPDSFRT